MSQSGRQTGSKRSKGDDSPHLLSSKRQKKEHHATPTRRSTSSASSASPASASDGSPNGNTNVLSVNVDIPPTSSPLSSPNGASPPYPSSSSSSSSSATPGTPSNGAHTEEKIPDYWNITLKGDPNQLVRVYADGIYDLFHFGHARALEQAKKRFPNVHLIVGVCGDEDTHRLKGKTVMTEQERAESVRHCKWVDEVIVPAPWVLTEEFLEKHKIDFVAHDAEPYADASGQALSSSDVYALVKRMGKFAATKRTEGISTTDLINRIVRDYDDFVRRNLSRGIDRKSLNVSLFKAAELKMEDKIKKVGDRVRTATNEWVLNSQKLVGDFLRLFEKNGAVDQYLHKFARKVPM